MGRAFVVQRERLIGGVDTQHERAAGHLDRRPGKSGPAGREGAGLQQQRRAGTQIQCLQHRFVVLVLVADHHPVHEIVVRFVG